MTVTQTTQNTPTTTSSIIGLSISTLILLITSWRLLLHYSGWLSKKCSCMKHMTSEEENNIHIRTEGLTTKRILHVLLWMTMLIEGVGYTLALFQSDDDNNTTHQEKKISYLLLDIVGRTILEYTTFSILTIYWFDFTRNARAGEEKYVVFTLFRWVLGLLTLCMIGMGIFSAVMLMMMGDSNVTLQDYLESRVHQVAILTYAVCWGIHSLIVCIDGGMVFRRIASLPNFASVGFKAKQGILSKMLFPVVCCGVSYGLRSGWYAVDYVRLRQENEQDNDTSISFEGSIGWWIGNVWLPTFVPSLCLLYSVRKRDREPGSIDGVSVSLLKADTLSGENDPFRNFNIVFRDLDDHTIVEWIVRSWWLNGGEVFEAVKPDCKCTF